MIKIWYKIEGREADYVEQPSTGEYILLCKVIRDNSIIPHIAPDALKAKKANEEYTTLSSDFFS